MGRTAGSGEQVPHSGQVAVPPKGGGGFRVHVLFGLAGWRAAWCCSSASQGCGRTPRCRRAMTPPPGRACH